jgi:dolichol-phosphate mannosyltransferase
MGTAEATGLGGPAASTAAETTASRCDLTVIIPALNEGPNLSRLLPELRATLEDLAVRAEILIVTSGTDAETQENAARVGAVVLQQRERGYGGALLTGFAAARGSWILTMDADLSHPTAFLRDLWQNRSQAEITIASRYVAGGRARMPATRLMVSRVLNRVFSRGLSLPIRDMSSGFRLYRAEVAQQTALRARDFDILQEILVRAYAQGWRTHELPFQYEPRQYGSSHARVFKFGMAYLRTFWSLWKLRNSILAADYDDRAYDSPIPLQRYWQRQRYRHISELTAGKGPVCDVGCGSSRIIAALPAGSVAVDVLQRKLRHARKFGRWLVNGSGFQLPFRGQSFPCVLCSQVIEHVPKESPILSELVRVLAPGGRLVLGTPDYARWEWVVTEQLYGFCAPGGYADEHIAHYSRQELVEHFKNLGFTHEGTRYILRGELILAFRKPA